MFRTLQQEELSSNGEEPQLGSVGTTAIGMQIKEMPLKQVGDIIRMNKTPKLDE